MAKSKDIGVGVLGLGMGRQVLNINKVDESRQKVIGLCDIDEDLLGATADEFGVGLKTTRYEELLACADIDVIGIYTPDKNHCGEILAALDAGKHLIVTKPMVNTGAIGRILSIYGIIHPPAGMDNLGICCTRGIVFTPGGAMPIECPLEKLSGLGQKLAAHLRVN